MRKIALLLLLLLLALAACERHQKPAETPLAEVNGEVLTLEAFRSTFTDEEWSRLSPERRKKEIEDWVNLSLIAQAADEQKLNEEKAIRQRIDYAGKKIKANALIARRLATVSIGEEELFNYYRLHRADFQSKLLEYDLQRILARDANTAEILLGRLREGYDFNAAVSEYSQELLRDRNGRLGFVSSTGKDSLFWREARKLALNEPGLANIEGAVYIIRYTDQREGSQDANFTEYRDEIRRILLRDKQRLVYDELLRELKQRPNEIYYY